MHISGQTITGAAGVVVGALITGGFGAVGAYFTNKRKTRQARRMIRTELGDLRNHTIGALMHETRVGERLPLATPRWNSYAPQLAEFFFNESKYEAVERAYEEFERFSDASLAKLNGTFGGSRETWIGLGRETLNRINAARRALGVDAPEDELVIPPAAPGSNERPTLAQIDRADRAANDSDGPSGE